MRAREGDFLKTKDQLFFDVKGFVHPPTRITAFLRYIRNGRSKRRYRKVYDLSERRDILERFYPKYLYFDKLFGMELQSVPLKDVETLYDPRERVGQLKESIDHLESSAYSMIQKLKKATGVPQRSLGISGSILVNLHTKQSDIDVIVYGSSRAESIKQGLTDLFKEDEGFKRYDRRSLVKLYHQRGMSDAMDFKSFVETEKKKVFQGIYRGFNYFIRCVKDWHEVDEEYGKQVYTSIGRIEAKARVTDASESLLTPCTYMIDDIESDSSVDVIPREIISYRGRFCEQATGGDTIAVRGKVEKVKSTRATWYRIVVGESRFDYMYPIKHA